jgi:hypothetical protein
MTDPLNRRRRLTERLGVNTPPKLRMDEVSQELRMSVWNTLHDLYGNYTTFFGMRARDIARDLRWETARYGANYGALVDRLKGEFLNQGGPALDFYELLDIVARGLEGVPGAVGDDYWRLWNTVLEGDGAHYRFVGGELVPLTNQDELSEIEHATKSPSQAVREHISAALRMLATRPNPDVRNAIKEAISAVEAALKVTTGRAAGDLRDALPPFEAQFGQLHGAFRGAIEKLYAYTSDEKGVRHSLLEADAKVDLDDARFMVVACSALCNFLIARAAARGWKS